jgi:hypothetical protein
MKDYATQYTKAHTEVNFTTDGKIYNYENITKEEKQDFIDWVLSTDETF